MASGRKYLISVQLQFIFKLVLLLLAYQIKMFFIQLNRENKHLIILRYPSDNTI